jgi:hypothetical protein
MSAGILFNKAFIKVDNENTIPFIQSGSSNSTEDHNGRERIARDWGNSIVHSISIIGNNNQILQSIDDIRAQLIEQYNGYDTYQHKYNDSSFGWFAGVQISPKSPMKTTFNSYKNFYKNGIKQAKTIEEYSTFGIIFSIEVYCWDEETDFIEKNIEYKPKTNIKSTETLIQLVNEYETYYKEFGYMVYISSNINDELLKSIK